MMRTLDTAHIRAPMADVFEAARNVERWPEWLPHYRWVTMRERRAGGGQVEMAAWRPFGPLRWPTWWVSEMAVDPTVPVVRYRHIDGITSGMDVEWRMSPVGTGTGVTIIHEWRGPEWPLVGGLAAEWIIGPVFVHGIASRTLAGIKRMLERQNG